MAKVNRLELLRRIQDRGMESVSVLAEEFGVNPSTIRRHLDVLEARQVIHRQHGNVTFVHHGQTLPYAGKSVSRMAQKHAIGVAMAHRIGAGQTVLLDSGTTTLEVAKALRYHSRVTVVTLDLRVAMEIASQEDRRLVVVGGELIPSNYTLFGPDTLRQVGELNVDVAVLGADAVDARGVTQSSTQEVAFKRAIMGIAKSSYLVADSSKFQRSLLLKVCRLDDFALGITDSGLDPVVAASYPIPIIRAPLSQNAVIDHERE